MASKEFVFQGFTARTHADAVRALFDLENIQRVIVSVAFVRESGVQQLAKKMQPHAGVTTILAGIRNDITSHQGLVALRSLAKDLFVVDTGTRQILFHPKLYLVRGTTRARMVIGSANLTQGGLHSNIEASLAVDFDLGDAADKAAVATIEAELDTLPGNFAANILRVTDDADIDAMLASGRVVDEKAASPPRPSASSGAAGPADQIPRIKLKVAPLPSAATTAIAVAKLKPASATLKPALPATGVQFQLAWQSKPLALRDLNLPEGESTNETGSMNLDKGLLPAGVDHRHYFREQIFAQLHWTPRTKTTEEAYAKFHLVIKGISHGQFDLRIGHTVGTTSKGYKQGNAMTRLSWGPAKTAIKNSDLEGRTLSLYRDLADPTRFVLEID